MRLRDGYLDVRRAIARRGADDDRERDARQAAHVDRLARQCRQDVCRNCCVAAYVPDIVTDQTSAHDPVNGYLPLGWTLEQWHELPRDRPERCRAAAKASMVQHVRAMLAFMRQGMPTVDYGNNIRQMAKDKGVAERLRFPGFVPAYIRPLFCRGVGPFRWVALVGRSRRHLSHRCEGQRAAAGSHAAASLARHGARTHPLPGLPARICWVGLGDRHRLGLAFNEMVARGEVSAPIVIGRDHSILDPSHPESRDGGDAGRIRCGVRLAVAERAAQYCIAVRPGCRCITAVASAWVILSMPAWSSCATARSRGPPYQASAVERSRERCHAARRRGLRRLRSNARASRAWICPASRCEHHDRSLRAHRADALEKWARRDDAARNSSATGRCRCVRLAR